MKMSKNFNELAEKHFDEIVITASELLQIPSVSGNEGGVADYIKEKMHALDYDEIHVDEVGNVIGIMKGTGGGKSTMLYCHMDTVEEGQLDKWKYPPFSGAVAEGKIWGRGASDTKGTLAPMLYTPYILKKAGIMPKGDVYCVCVVQEEVAGFGAMHMAAEERYLTDFALVGEATENDIAIACKGRIAIDVTINGRSCHASIAETGVNPFDYLHKFLEALKDFPVAYDENFGSSKITPTRITSSEEGTNIVPSTLVLTLDYRSVPAESNESIVERVRTIVDQCMFEGITVDMEIIMVDITTYTGFKGRGLNGLPAFQIDKNSEIVLAAKSALEKTFGREVKTKPWAFATDSGHYASKGVQVIGYSPAEIKYCHTTEDNIDLNMLKEGIAGCLAIAERLSNIEK
jgi:putative selenium metabolism hydrolase